MKTRTEYDSLGPVEVPADALWGAQTQRSLHFFAIGEERFSAGFIDAFVTVKQAAARANRKLGKLAPAEQQWIEAACVELKSGRYWQQFPLSVWQTGSGTQTNMNVNEVIAHLANRLAGSEPGSKTPIHPNDHVNLSQSSNDVFPSVMHVASLLAVRQQLLPALARLIGSLHEKQQQFAEHIKSGRTHLMDATPVTLGQEFSAYAAQLQYGQAQVVEVLPQLAKLALGGSAVGTGLNTHPQWAATVTGCISELAGEIFVPADNFFMALSGHEALLDLHSRLNLLATSLYKISADLRLMASGPRCGLAEISLPANEPGSSIMPGKVNPTQVEAMTMVAIQVIGNHSAISFAASQGQLELNVYKPLIIHNVLQSIRLLADAMNSLERHCISGIVANEEKMQQLMQQSLMLVTALTPHIGYDKAAAAAKLAHEQQLSLKQAVLQLNLLGEAEFDRYVRPDDMLAPPQAE